MNENTTNQVVTAAEGVATAATSVNWGKVGKGVGIAGAIVGGVALIGKVIDYFCNKNKQDVETSEDDQTEDVDSVESDEE